MFGSVFFVFRQSVVICCMPGVGHLACPAKAHEQNAALGLARPRRRGNCGCGDPMVDKLQKYSVCVKPVAKLTLPFCVTMTHNMTCASGMPSPQRISMSATDKVGCPTGGRSLRWASAMERHDDCTDSRRHAANVPIVWQMTADSVLEGIAAEQKRVYLKMLR